MIFITGPPAQKMPEPFCSRHSAPSMCLNLSVVKYTFNSAKSVCPSVCLSISVSVFVLIYVFVRFRLIYLHLYLNNYELWLPSFVIIVLVSFLIRIQTEIV